MISGYAPMLCLVGASHPREREDAVATTEERDLLEVVRAAARARSVARREMREHVLRQRQRFASTLEDSRKDFGQRLLLAAGLGQAELDSMRKREEETVRMFLEEERRAELAPMGGTTDHCS
jgi:hypothetical protein